MLEDCPSIPTRPSTLPSPKGLQPNGRMAYARRVVRLSIRGSTGRPGVQLRTGQVSSQDILTP